MIEFARKFSIAIRLNFLFFSFLAIILTIYFALNSINSSIRKDSERFYNIVDFSRELQVNFKIQVQEWKNILIRGAVEEDFQKYKDRFFKLSKQIQNDLQKLEEEGKDIPELQVQVHSLKQKHLELESSYQTALKLYNINDLRTIQIVDRAVKGIDREPTKKFDEIVLLIQNHSNTVFEREQNLFQRIMLISGIFFIIIISFISQVVIRSIQRPLSEINERLENIAKGSGDLTSRIPVLAKDEVSHLADNFNYFINQIHQIVKIIIETIKNLSESSNGISNAAGKMSSLSQIHVVNADEIRVTIDQVSTNVQKTFTNSSKQINTLNQLQENIISLNDIIKQTDSKVQLSLNYSNKVSKEAASSDSSLKSMSGSMQKITESSGKISGIMGIIGDISNQINLLSLNAAIEAARAGESGKGFAVVADEIAKLAEKTSSSIKQIDNLIKANNEEITLGMKNANIVYELLNKIMGSVGKISSEIHEIFDLSAKQLEISNYTSEEIESSKKIANDILAITEEEKNAFKEVLKAIAEINSIAHQNSSATEVLFTNSTDMQVISEKLLNTIRSFKV